MMSILDWLRKLWEKLHPPPPPPPPPPSEIRAALFAAVNAQRAAQVRPPLHRDARLDLAAQQWAEQLARDGYQHHSTTFGERIMSAGYVPMMRAEENIHGGP